MKKLKPEAKALIKKIATGLFFVLVVYLLVSKARTIEWSEVTAAITKMDPARLFVAGLLTAVGFAVYSLIDILSKVHIGHKVSNLKTAFAGFLSYAFNLNLGSLVGGIAFRFRIYSRFGLDSKTIGRIVGFSILSNWSGYVLLNGLVLSIAPPLPPEGWQIPVWAIRGVGVVLLLASMGYLAACFLSKKREIHFFKKDFELASGPMALAQLSISSLSWLSIAGIIFVLFGGRVQFNEVLAIFMISGLAAVATHVPAGLGVIEAVFLKFLGHRIPETQIIATLLAFRAIYYIAPLCIAIVSYVTAEALTKGKGRTKSRVFRRKTLKHRPSHQPSH